MRADEVVRRGIELGQQCGGVVTAAQLRQAGVDRTVVSRLVRQGRWTQLWRGTYLVDGQPSPLALAHAAVGHAAPPAGAEGLRPVVTGLAGAAAAGLRWVPSSSRVQVLVGKDVQRRSNEHVLVRRAHDLADVPTWRWGGLAVARPGRLVVDGARECRSLRDVRGLVLGAVADRRTTAEEVLELLERGAVGGTAWCRRAARDAADGAASPPEAELADDLRGCGHPFYVNADLHVRGRFIARCDVYLVGTGVGGEMDSQEWHGEAEQLDATLMRHELAQHHGLTLVHVTPARFRSDPAAFTARLVRAVAEQRREGLGEPAGLVVTPRGPLLH